MSTASVPERSPLRLAPRDMLAVLADALRHGQHTAQRFRDPDCAAPADFGAASCRSLGLDPAVCAAVCSDLFALDRDPPPLSGDAPFSAWAATLHAATGGRPRALRFHTSGSTGRPVAHSLAFALLEHEIVVAAPRFADARRVVSVMPAHHCFGFAFGVLLPRFLGLPRLSCLPLPTEALLGLLRPADLVVGFPSFWDAMVRTDAAMAGILPLSAGAPWTGARINALLAAGTDGAREIYGASELGAVGYRCVTAADDADAVPFTLLEHWQEEPDPENGAPERRIARRLPEGGVGPFFALPDTLLWTGPRTFRPTGRRDKAVQVGGRNVYPAKTARLLARHAAVAECRVRLMRPDEGPQRLKAFVVLKPGYSPDAALREDLALWCKTFLAPLERPRHFTFGPAIPASAFGKEADW